MVVKGTLTHPGGPGDVRHVVASNASSKLPSFHNSRATSISLRRVSPNRVWTSPERRGGVAAPLAIRGMLFVCDDDDHFALRLPRRRSPALCRLGGDDHGAPIVFVPGMTDVADDYTQILPLFGRRAGSRADRGHGRSSAPASGYDLATLSRRRRCRRRRVDRRACPHRDVLAEVGVALGSESPEKEACRSRSRLRGGGARPTERSLGVGLLEAALARDSRKEHLDSARRDTRHFRAAQARSDVGAARTAPIPAARGAQRQTVLVGDADWAGYRQLFPARNVISFDDSPHDIFRPDRGRYPRLVRDHVDRVDRDRDERSVSLTLLAGP